MIEKWTDCITDPRGAWDEIERLRARVAEFEAAQKAQELARIGLDFFAKLENPPCPVCGGVRYWHARQRVWGCPTCWERGV